MVFRDRCEEVLHATSQDNAGKCDAYIFKVSATSHPLLAPAPIPGDLTGRGLEEDDNGDYD